MFNQYYTSTHCQHNIPAISCSLCNRTQPIEYNQFETRIKNYEEQLKEYRKIVVDQEPQYLYVYNCIDEGKTWISPSLLQDTPKGWAYMGKVEVVK